MSVELAHQKADKHLCVALHHQKADKHLCVALHRKVRIRLHPSMESVCGIASNMG